MDRVEFLSKMGVGLVAACAGCSLVSCGSGSKNDNPTPMPGSQPPPTGSGIFLTADLSNELLSVGASKSGGGVILVRLAAGSVAGSFTAVQIACTHEGTSINYNAGQGIFICPLHGSEFDTSGKVIMGPAASNLRHYTIAINNNALTVSA